MVRIKLPKEVLFLVLFLILFFSVFLASTRGATGISLTDFIEALLIKSKDLAFTREVLLGIRLPRVVLGAVVGGGLGLSGAIMQGLFKNPLADPGIIGISTGSALSVVTFMVLGASIPPFAFLINTFGALALPTVAFFGAILATVIVYKLGTVGDKTIVQTMLLAGVALNSIAGALTGFLIFISDDTTLRSFTFWSMGSLAPATWENVIILFVVLVFSFLIVWKLSNELNALLMGEREASYLGINVELIKKTCITIAALNTGITVAVCGVIGFVGLVVPHIVRLLFGSDHKTLIPASILVGGILLVLADLLARTIVSPAEIPLGTITSMIGAPFFLYLLLQEKKKGGGM